jgi:hypothetical protein
MTTMALPVTAQLRCKDCRKVVMEVTGLREVDRSGIGISRRCKCGVQNNWSVLPDLPRVERYGVK